MSLVDRIPVPRDFMLERTLVARRARQPLLFINAAFVGMLAVIGCNSDEKPTTVNPSALSPGPIRHEELSPDLVTRITKLHDTFGEVDPTPLSKWLEDFKRDQHPESEVEIYEGMARAYTAFCHGRPLAVDAKREVYGVVMQRSAAPDEQVLETVRVKAISRDDVKTILRLYDLPPKPISVTTKPQTR